MAVEFNPTGLFDKPTRVVIAGPRCTGATTLAKHLAPDNAVWITSHEQLVNVTDGRTAESEPACFVIDVGHNLKIIKLVKTLFETDVDRNCSYIFTRQYDYDPKIDRDYTFTYDCNYKFKVTKKDLGFYKAPAP